MAELKYCCWFMEQQLNHTCSQCGDGADCPDVLVSKSKAQGGEGTVILIARNAEYACNFCPFCGTKLEIQKE